MNFHVLQRGESSRSKRPDRSLKLPFYRCSPACCRSS